MVRSRRSRGPAAVQRVVVSGDGAWRGRDYEVRKDCRSERRPLLFWSAEFGAWPYDRGKVMGIVMDDRSPGRQAVVDGFIDLRPSGVHVALSGTAYVNPDGKSGRLNVWGRSGPGWASRTGDRFTGTWRCP